MRANLKPLNDAIRELGKETLEEGVITPAEFVDLFRERYPGIYEDFMEHGHNSFLKNKSRVIIKTMIDDVAKAYCDQKLPGVDDEQLPHMLPCKKETEEGMTSVWVKRREAEIDQVNDFTRSIEENAKACMYRTVDWNTYVSKILPIMEANPGWNVGQAEDYLIEQGVDLGPLFDVKEDETAH